MDQFWWVVLPYLSLVVMVVGLLYRYRYAQKGWGSKSSEILERRWLKWGSVLFHYGILCVIAGHVMGLVVPISVYHALGVSDEFYHTNADLFGGLAGLMATAGLLILLLRRVFNRRVRHNSQPSDYVALAMLLVVVGLGVLVTVGYNNVFGPYEYRTTVGPWFRGLLLLHPNSAQMASVPILLKIHIISSFVLFATWPFTRLVHVFSAPVRYPFRAPLQYRARNGFRRAGQ
ncbi:MAG: respiratory nitrate reductase subunit gamma [Alicyclobacillus sp.]|nr:respiratory nitrate reductase subunit gamma [Alicyclobacillus sp.]